MWFSVAGEREFWQWYSEAGERVIAVELYDLLEKIGDGTLWSAGEQ